MFIVPPFDKQLACRLLESRFWRAAVNPFLIDVFRLNRLRSIARQRDARVNCN
jgi:hypothetical protein